MVRWLAVLVLPALAGLMLTACGADARQRTLTVSSASSLTDAFQEAGKVFEAQHQGVRVRFQFAATSALRAQLEQGAPADVFASADQRNMDLAVRAGVIEGRPVTFARNRLAVVVPVRAPKVAAVADMARPGLRLVLAAPQTPIGAYVDAMLELAAKAPELGPDFVRGLRANVVSQVLNVRQAIATVQLGEADATLAYVSDVAGPAGQRLQAIPVPDRFQVPVSYPIGVVAGSPRKELAEAFIRLVTADDGQRILDKWGFTRP